MTGGHRHPPPPTQLGGGGNPGFGGCDADAAWCLRVRGHHLSLLYLLVGSRCYMPELTADVSPFRYYWTVRECHPKQMTAGSPKREDGSTPPPTWAAGLSPSTVATAGTGRPRARPRRSLQSAHTWPGGLAPQGASSARQSSGGPGGTAGQTAPAPCRASAARAQLECSRNLAAEPPVLAKALLSTEGGGRSLGASGPGHWPVFQGPSFPQGERCCRVQAAVTDRDREAESQGDRKLSPDPARESSRPATL